MRLFGDGVLVGVDCFVRVGGGDVLGVDCWNDGEEVLEFVEVVGGCGDGAVEGVEETGVEGAEGEFGDYVGEVESFAFISISSTMGEDVGWGGIPV